ncbi:MAG: hypothetical protein LBU65_04540 [Planctomycetaceae bacterium]|jgi:hypothetical protein|nr:hypothetical protein [Planctomycetaceae bacterium]
MTYISSSEYLDIKKFAVRFLLIGGLIFCIDKGLAYWSTQAAMNDLSIPESPVHLYRGDTNAEIVFFGNSKTHVNFDAAALSAAVGSKAWNFAIDGTNIEMARFLFEEYLLHNPVPKIAIIQADYGLISKNLPGAFRSYLVSPFTNISPHTAAYFNPGYRDKLAFFFFRCKSLPNGEGIGAIGRSMINYALGRCASAAPGDSTNGSLFSPPHIDIEAMKKCWDDVPHKAIQLNTDKVAEYRRIAETAKQHGVRLIFYGPPQYGKMNPEITSEVDRLFGQLASEYENAAYWNFRELPELWQHPEWWKDDVHLNKDGAEVLTRKFIEQLKKIPEQVL